MEALAAISATPPSFSADRIADAVAASFGLDGSLDPLVSERDQNFRLVTAANARYLVKVSGALETPATTAFQTDTLLHLESQHAVAVPRVVRTVDGATCAGIDDGETCFALRVLDWVDGVQLESLGIDVEVAARFGTALAQLDTALAGMSYGGPDPVLLWDLQRVCELRPLLGYVEGSLRERVSAAVDAYEKRVLPRVRQLRRQVIHSDANPENVLDRDGSIGFIDFGDIVRAPRVFDVAIAASYLSPGGDDPLALLRPFVGAYHAVSPLDDAECEVFFDLVRARLATSITLLYWRLGERPEGDEYRRKSQELEGSASRFLAALDDMGRKQVTFEINHLRAL